MKRKANEKELMRQKVNVSPALLNKWKDMYLFDIRQMVHGSLLEKEDLGTTFEHQGRVFEIVGMGEGRSLMLRETREEGVFYWECTRQFVQMKLERYNQQFTRLANTSKTILTPMAYSDGELYLAPLKAKRGAKKVVEEDEDTIYVDSYEEYDMIEDVQTETETDEIF
jgi:hypothetical protein